MIKKIERLVVKKEGIELQLDVLYFKEEANPLSRKATEFRSSYCKNTYSNRNSRGLAGHIYLVVHAGDETGIPMAESTFHLLTQ